MNHLRKRNMKKITFGQLKRLVKESKAKKDITPKEYIEQAGPYFDWNDMVGDLKDMFGLSEDEAMAEIEKVIHEPNLDESDEGDSTKRELEVVSVDKFARGMPTKDGTKKMFVITFALDGDKATQEAKVWALSEDEAIQQLLDHYNAIRTDIPMFEEGKKGKKMGEVKLEIPHDRSSKGFSQGAAEVNGKFYAVDMQWFDEPSQWGIGNGRISRLLVTSDDEDGKWVIHYDRGWDVRPKDAETRAILKAILQEFDPDNELFMLNENTKITLTIGQLKKLMKG